MAKKVKLTPKQRLFCKEYLIDKNATQAAIRARYSKRTAHQMGAENLRKPYIRNRIEKGLKRQAKKAEITADKIIAEAAKLAFINAQSLFDKNGNLLPISELPPEVAAAVASVEVVSTYKNKGSEDDEPEYLKKVKLWDKKGSLELLAKLLHLLGNNGNGNGNGGDIVINIINATKEKKDRHSSPGIQIKRALLAEASEGESEEV